MDRTVVVGIGRYIGQKSMDWDAWDHFQHLVRRALEARGLLYFAGTGDGVYEGTTEESATFVASFPEYWLAELRLELETLARRFSQESIALTIGDTQFVQAYPTSPATKDVDGGQNPPP